MNFNPDDVEFIIFRIIQEWSEDAISALVERLEKRGLRDSGELINSVRSETQGRNAVGVYFNTYGRYQEIINKKRWYIRTITGMVYDDEQASKLSNRDRSLISTLLDEITLDALKAYQNHYNSVQINY